jgi:RimJ/RimL family protein N-acetyltransferase
MPPTLETDRMILRVPVQADFDAGWAEFHGDAESMRYLGGPMPRSVAWRMLAQCAGMWSLRGYGPFSAIDKVTGRWLGRVGPWEPEGWPEREVGWLFHRSAWGHGYAAEAARACLAYVFRDLAWPRVGHMIHPGNARSKRVAERVGSAFVAEVRLPPPMDAAGPTEMWGQSAEAWRATSPPAA